MLFQTILFTCDYPGCKQDSSYTNTLHPLAKVPHISTPSGWQLVDGPGIPILLCPFHVLSTAFESAAPRYGGGVSPDPEPVPVDSDWHASTCACEQCMSPHLPECRCGRCGDKKRPSLDPCRGHGESDLG